MKKSWVVYGGTPTQRVASANKIKEHLGLNTVRYAGSFDCDDLEKFSAYTYGSLFIIANTPVNIRNNSRVVRLEAMLIELEYAEESKELEK